MPWSPLLARRSEGLRLPTRRKVRVRARAKYERIEELPEAGVFLAADVRSATRGTTACLFKTELRCAYAARVNSRAHASMLASGQRSSTGPPSINKTLPVSSSDSKNSAQPSAPPIRFDDRTHIDSRAVSGTLSATCAPLCSRSARRSAQAFPLP